LEPDVSMPHLTQKWLIIAGTRPEIIKMAPVLYAARNHAGVTARFISTGQHRELAEQALADFGITPDYALHVMHENQSLTTLSARLLDLLHPIYVQEKPDAVLVQGDTTTTLMGALAAFYHRIPVFHIEAGLRSGNMLSPYPEEANRILASRLTHTHFAPTESARANLLNEGVADSQIHITGNTGIDALLTMRARMGADFPTPHTMPSEALASIAGDRPFILVTLHRRENFGSGMHQLCEALGILAKKHPNVPILFPVHFNPNVRQVVFETLRHHPTIHLVEPQGYAAFVWLMQHCRFILSDSGGIQEESTALGKPIIVARDTTERGEAINAKSAVLTGVNGELICSIASRLLDDDAFYRTMAVTSDSFGDGQASARIVKTVYATLDQSARHAGG